MKISTFIACGCLVLTTACASIVHSTQQTVLIESEPSGAEVIVDGIRYTTPVVVELKGASSHLVQAFMEGYQPTHDRIRGEMRIWSGIIGNIFNLTLFIGMTIDFATTGAGWELQEEFLITLRPQL